MGDVIDFLEYKRQKELRRKVYTSYKTENDRLCLFQGIVVTRYQLALEKQLYGEYALYKYFFPDFDW